MQNNSSIFEKEKIGKVITQKSNSASTFMIEMMRDKVSINV